MVDVRFTGLPSVLRRPVSWWWLLDTPYDIYNYCMICYKLPRYWYPALWRTFMSSSPWTACVVYLRMIWRTIQRIEHYLYLNSYRNKQSMDWLVIKSVFPYSNRLETLCGKILPPNTKKSTHHRSFILPHLRQKKINRSQGTTIMVGKYRSKWKH